MRKKFNLGGLTKAQKTLPPKLQALIQKKKKKKEKPKPSMMAMAMKDKKEWLNFVQKEKLQLKESLKFIHLHMQICMDQLYAQAK